MESWTQIQEAVHHFLEVEVAGQVVAEVEVDLMDLQVGKVVHMELEVWLLEVEAVHMKLEVVYKMVGQVEVDLTEAEVQEVDLEEVEALEVDHKELEVE